MWPSLSDPEIHHGIPELINSLGLAVLTRRLGGHLAETEDHPSCESMDVPFTIVSLPLVSQPPEES